MGVVYICIYARKGGAAQTPRAEHQSVEDAALAKPTSTPPTCAAIYAKPPERSNAGNRKYSDYRLRQVPDTHEHLDTPDNRVITSSQEEEEGGCIAEDGGTNIRNPAPQS